MALRNSGSKTPVNSRWIIWEDTTKYRGPFDANEEATGRISPTWAQSKAAYLCNSNAAPYCLALRALSSPSKINNRHLLLSGREQAPYSCRHLNVKI